MLKIDHVSKTFNLSGNIEDIKVALDDISLEIQDGEFVTIIGGNGSGKTTLMNIISGTIKQDAGSVLIDDIVLDKLKEYQRALYIGRVFQDPKIGTISDMSVLENMELAIRRGQKRKLIWGFKKENKELFIKELTKLDLGLENRLEQKAGLLSGGQRQALTLLMANFVKPKILLLDEHTAALDPKTASKVMHFTNEIVNNNKLTTLMITHNMNDALKYGNRLIMLNQGHIIFDVKGEEKAKLTVQDLLNKFNESNADISDKLVLSD